MGTKQRAEIRLELSTKTTDVATQAFINVLKRLLTENNQHIVSSSVFLKDINKKCLLIVIEYFTEPFTLEEFDTLKQHVNFSIKKIIEENDIQLAGDSNTIIINSDNKEGYVSS